MDVAAPAGSYLTPRLEHATVRDAMRPRVLSCDPATPLVTVAQRMASEHVHAIVVLGMAAHDTDRRAWSVVTDHDVLRCAPRVEELTAAEAASGSIAEVHPDDPLGSAAARMAESGLAHVLVVDDRTRRPIGVLSTLDIAGIVGWGRA
jgi:CBS domain-containing protein